jgi:histidinol-phosphate/aromatic aminotransferase/cobyric acid decarboxylase-like protein
VNSPRSGISESSCRNYELGTLISSVEIVEKKIAKLQPLWSVNGFAQDFFVAALNEKDYC